MRKGIMAVLLAIATAQLAGVAVADATYEGVIIAGHPLTGLGGGVTEIATPCDPASPLTGVDGHWFDVTGVNGVGFTLEMDAMLDADAWFYDADCNWIESVDGAQNGFATAESGALPASTAFVVVNGFAGSGGFSLTIHE